MGYIPAQSPHSLKKYLLSTYYVPSIVLGPWYMAVNKTETFACPHGVGTLVVERDDKEETKVSKL